MTPQDSLGTSYDNNNTEEYLQSASNDRQSYPDPDLFISQVGTTDSFQQPYFMGTAPAVGVERAPTGHPQPSRLSGRKPSKSVTSSPQDARASRSQVDALMHASTTEHALQHNNTARNHQQRLRGEKSSSLLHPYDDSHATRDSHQPSPYQTQSPRIDSRYGQPSGPSMELEDTPNHDEDNAYPMQGEEWLEEYRTEELSLPATPRGYNVLDTGHSSQPQHINHDIPVERADPSQYPSPTDRQLPTRDGIGSNDSPLLGLSGGGHFAEQPIPTLASTTVQLPTNHLMIHTMPDASAHSCPSYQPRAQQSTAAESMPQVTGSLAIDDALRAKEVILIDDSGSYHKMAGEEEWHKAVRHAEIWNDLLRWADSVSKYRVKQVKGSKPGDRTAPVKGHENWGEDREHRPDVLFQLEKPKGGVTPECPTRRFMWQGARVLDRNGQWMRHWDDVPVTICSAIKGWHLEALIRRNPSLSMPDIQARMMDGTQFITRQKSTALTNRTMRFRRESLNITWGTERKNSQHSVDFFKCILPAACIRRNSTKGYRDMNDKEEGDLERFLHLSNAEKAVELAKMRRESQSQAPSQSATDPQPFNHGNLRAGISSSSVSLVPTNGGGHSWNQQFQDAHESGLNIPFSPNQQALQSSLSGRRYAGQINPYKTQSILGRKRPHDHDDESGPATSRALQPQHDEDETAHSNTRQKRQRGNTWRSSDPNLSVFQDNPLEEHHHVGIGDDKIQDASTGPDRVMTDDHYDLDEDLDELEDIQDAFSDTWIPDQLAVDQWQEPSRRGTGLMEGDTDKLEPLVDPVAAPSYFRSPVDPAAYRAQEDLESLNDKQKELLSGHACILLGVGKTYTIVCLDDKIAQKAHVKADRRVVFDEHPLRVVQQELEAVVIGSNRKSVSSHKGKDVRSEDNAELRDIRAYLPVGKVYIIICAEEEEARRVVAEAGNVTTWELLTPAATYEEIRNLLVRHEDFDQGLRHLNAKQRSMTRENESPSMIDGEYELAEDLSENDAWKNT